MNYSQVLAFQSKLERARQTSATTASAGGGVGWQVDAIPHDGNADTPLYIVDGRTITLNLHPGQMLMWNAHARWVFMLAGTQGGKTALGPWWLNREMKAFNYAGDYIAATSSYDLFKLKMLPTMREVFEHILGIARYWSGDKVLELQNLATGLYEAQRADDKMYGRIILRSASSAGGLESLTGKAAWLDEVGQDEFPLQAWEAVQRRLSLARGRVLGTTTIYNLGWLKQLIYDRWKAGDPDIEVIQFASVLNPAFPQAEFDAAKGRMQDSRFRMFYEGQFTKPEGLIYKAFIDSYQEDGGHLVKPFAIPQEWPRIVSIDPGAVNHCKLWWAHDTEMGVWYVYRELLQGNLSTREHADAIRRQARDNGERIIGYYVGAKSEKQQRMDYQAAGIRPVYEPPVADVESGIDSVVTLLKQHRLFVFDTLTGLRDQFGRYSRVTDSTGEATQKIQDKEKFHFLDSLRYGAVAASRPVGVGFG